MEAESEMIDLEMDAGNGAAPVDETDDEATAELPPPRPRVSLPERPDSRPEMPGERGRSPDQLGGDDGKILVVGQEIVFNGKISSLDRLVVEGKVEAKIKDCRTIEIGETGHFKGEVEFERGGQIVGDLQLFVEGAEANGKGAAAGRKKPRVTKAKRTPAR